MVMVGWALSAVAVTAACSTITEQPPSSAPTAADGRQSMYLDSVEPIDAQWTHTARRADLVTIAQYWQMDEPVWLSSLLYAKEVYRLWYKPSLYDWSVVRVVREADGWKLSVRTLDARDRSEASKCILSKAESNPLQCRYPTLKVNNERTLQPPEIEQLVQYIGRLDFWNQAEHVKSLPEFDGVNWVLEGMREDGQTRGLYRTNPPRNEVFYRFAEHLLNIAKVSAP
jgi:hypothetical protein